MPRRRKSSSRSTISGRQPLCPRASVFARSSSIARTVSPVVRRADPDGVADQQVLLQLAYFGRMAMRSSGEVAKAGRDAVDGRAGRRPTPRSTARLDCMRARARRLERDGRRAPRATASTSSSVRSSPVSLIVAGRSAAHSHVAPWTPRMCAMSLAAASSRTVFAARASEHGQVRPVLLEATPVVAQRRRRRQRASRTRLTDEWPTSRTGSSAAIRRSRPTRAGRATSNAARASATCWPLSPPPDALAGRVVLVLARNSAGSVARSPDACGPPSRRSRARPAARPSRLGCAVADDAARSRRRDPAGWR